MHPERSDCFRTAFQLFRFVIDGVSFSTWRTKDQDLSYQHPTLVYYIPTVLFHCGGEKPFVSLFFPPTFSRCYFPL